MLIEKLSKIMSINLNRMSKWLKNKVVSSKKLSLYKYHKVNSKLSNGCEEERTTNTALYFLLWFYIKRFSTAVF